jgi:mono/diheme cytochrome c family protein
MNTFLHRLMSLLAVGALLSAGMVIGFDYDARAQTASADAVANGKRVYLADGCFTCHGRAGQGGAMNYPAPPLAQIEMPVDSFIAYLRVAPNDMPAYTSEVLSDRDAADIHAFLRSLPGRKSAKEFPLLNQ